MYKSLDPTILQSKTVRYIIEVMDNLLENNEMANQDTKSKAEFILREAYKADYLRLNRQGRPIKNEKSNRTKNRQGTITLPKQ